MKKSKKRWKHITILIVGMAVLLSFSGIESANATGLSEAQKEKAGLEEELKEAQKMINSLSGSKENMEEAIKELDQKLRNISKKISELENQLSEKQVSVEETEEELKQAEQDRENQYEDMKLRIQFMYENQTSTAVEMMLSAGSIAEFLNSAEYISQISQYDRNMLVKYEETIENIAKIEETLQTEISELRAMKQKVEEEQKAVASLVQEKELKLAETEGELVDAKELAKAYEAEIQAQEEIIAQIQAAEAARKAEEEARKAEEEAKKAAEEAAKQEEDNTEDNSDDDKQDDGTQDDGTQDDGTQDDGTTEDNTDDNTDEGNDDSEDKPSVSAFTWPCPSSSRVTSDYGPRESPTAGASSYHKGIDIGAAGGADIVAAADGTVVFAGYSNSAGNYVTVSHGGGLYTVYMHCSSLTVSNGQNVSRGQVIAKVGSTGISTGNHLHFGVSLNGAYVNPWNYL